MVIGLVSQTSATEIGKLARTYNAPAAAMAIWVGEGIQAKNNPTANASATERRFKCHKFGSCSLSPRKRRLLMDLIFSGSGRYFFIIFLAMAVLAGKGCLRILTGFGVSEIAVLVPVVT